MTPRTPKSGSEKGPKKGKKVRVSLRRNRSKPARISDWTRRARQAEDHVADTESSENVVARGDLSRRRTVILSDEDAAAADSLLPGTVVAMRGLFADVDDGDRTLPCTVRRMLRTRLIDERHPVTVGDRVRFRLREKRGRLVSEGVIEAVEPRRGRLCRKVGRRIHTLVANVDYAVIVASADQPAPKPHLIDRYLVAAHAGEITPVICMNKIDLDANGAARSLLERYASMGYRTICTSATRGMGVVDFRTLLMDKATVLAGQSGVGKSALLNAIQPGLRLKTGDVVGQTSKGRHTTTTATLLRLDVRGYVVDTPGTKSFDLSTVPQNELELHFVDLAAHVAGCKFPDCTHTHEADCAVKRAVETGRIHSERYESYVRLFEEAARSDRRTGKT